MSLETLWQDKGRWLEEAHSEVLNRMRMASALSIAEQSPSGQPEDRLIVVYGPPQVGKTALILHLIGVREDAMERVCGLIRGSAKQGDSSTSHAFLYMRSEDDSFCIWTQKGVACDPEQIRRLEREEDVSLYIDNLRRRLNEGRGLRDVVCLAIPRKYCQEDNGDGFRLNLLDIPGIGSRDEWERPQVDYLLEQYVRLAAAIVVVCTLSQIQSLSRMQVPVSGDTWWGEEQKYIVVLTYFYSSLVERSVLDTCPNDEMFCSQAIELCYEKVGPVYDEWRGDGQKKRVPLRLFPMELDESLRSYLRELDSRQKAVAVAAQDRIRQELRRCIAERKNGDSFPLFIRTLGNHIDLLGQKKTWQLEQALANHKSRQQNWDIQAEKLSKKIQEMEDRQKTLTDTVKDAQEKLQQCVDSADKLVEARRKELGELGSALLGHLPLTKVEAAGNLAWECIGEIQQLYLTMEFEPEWMEKPTKVMDDSMVECYQQLQTQFRGGGLFRPSIEACQNLFCRCIKDMQKGWKALYEENIQKQNSQVRKLTRRIKKMEEYRIYTQEESVKEQTRLRWLESERAILEEQMELDKRTLQNAMTIAEGCYLRQKKALTDGLKRNKSPANRIAILLVLAAIEQDYYNDIIMAGAYTDG